jgi:hypothetical protein
METSLLRQIRLLQILVIVLGLIVAAMIVNLFRPFLPAQTFRVINAERLNIREPDGTLKLVLSDSEHFKGRNGKASVTFAGLIFCNQEGRECGGLTYDGNIAAGGQRAEADLTFDQFHQDQNVVFEHHESKDAQDSRIIDGLAVNARPDWSKVKEEYGIYDEVQRCPARRSRKTRRCSNTPGGEKS